MKWMVPLILIVREGEFKNTMAQKEKHRWQRLSSLPLGSKPNACIYIKFNATSFFVLLV